MHPRVQMVVMGTLWSFLSAFFFLKWHAPVRGWTFGALGLSFLVSGLLVPPAAAALHRALKALTIGLVTLISWVVLGSMFFVVIMPVGWVLRWTGSLRTRKGLRERVETYWTDRPDEPLSAERYLRPF